MTSQVINDTSMMKGESTRETSKEAKKVLSYRMKTLIRKNTAIFFALLGFLIAAAYLEMSIILHLKDVMNLAFIGDITLVRDRISDILILLGILIPTLVIVSRMSARYITSATYNLQNRVMDSLLLSGGKEVSKEKNTKYISVLTNNIKLVESHYFGAMYNIFAGVISFVAGLILVIIVDWKILLVALGVGFVIIVGVAILSAVVATVMRKLSEDYEEYTNYVNEILYGFQIVKANHLIQRVSKGFSKRIQSLQDEKAKFQKIQVKVNIFMQLFINVFLIGIIVVALFNVWNGNYTSSDIIYIVTTFSIVLMPGLGLLMNIPEFKAGREALLKIDELLIETDVEQSPKADFLGFESEIELKNIKFQYGENIIFSDANAVFEKNKKYLIVGTSGQGKSTLLNLLRLNIEVTDGEVLVDKHPMKLYNRTSVNQFLGYLEQQVFLFEDTLENNICLFHEYSEDELIASLEQSGLHEFLISREEGLNFIVKDDGSNISGGEKVRMALSRAFVRKTQIMLLDEPFANLDDNVSIDIERSLLNRRDITLFNVSHVFFKENIMAYDKVVIVEDQKIKMVSPNKYMQQNK